MICRNCRNWHIFLVGCVTLEILVEPNNKASGVTHQPAYYDNIVSPNLINYLSTARYVEL